MSTLFLLFSRKSIRMSRSIGCGFHAFGKKARNRDVPVLKTPVVRALQFVRAYVLAYACACVCLLYETLIPMSACVRACVRADRCVTRRGWWATAWLCWTSSRCLSRRHDIPVFVSHLCVMLDFLKLPPLPCVPAFTSWYPGA